MPEYHLQLPDPAQARGAEPSLSFRSTGGPALAQELQDALRSPALFERWRAMQPEPDEVEPEDHRHLPPRLQPDRPEQHGQREAVDQQRVVPRDRQLDVLRDRQAREQAHREQAGHQLQPPEPELGNMLQDGSNSIDYAPHMLLVPLVLTIAAVLSFVLIAEGVNRLNPLSERRSWLAI